MINFANDLHNANIKVFGIGGGGGNTVNCLYERDPSGVDLYLLNTDKQVLNASPVANKFAMGQNLTRGLGAGAKPEIGKNAAIESEEMLRSYIKGTDLLFLAVGMGGGTGTGASPEIGRIAREEGVLTVAVVTLPFSFEGNRRINTAKAGVEMLKENVDTSIIIENQKILPLISKTSTVQESFEMVDNILCKAVIAITDLITKPGLINLDFADLRTILHEGGSAFMVTGTASGADRSEKAATQAINSPLMTRSTLAGARRIIINISGNSEMTLDEVNGAASIIHDKADEDCNIIIGTVVDEKEGDDLSVTVIATEFKDELEEEYGEQDHKVSRMADFNGAKKENPAYFREVQDTVITEYKSPTGRLLIMDEPNLEYPTFLRTPKKKAAMK